MTDKPGRNDPCPCGSGRKYKQCCLSKADASMVDNKDHDGAVERAMAWLVRHRKAFLTAVERLVAEVLDEEGRRKLEHLDPQTWNGIQINLMEWLLAEGDLSIKDVRRRVSESLLGPGGPLLTVGQRSWLKQLAERPLRLYVVTDVVPGVKLTLCDVLDTESPPIVVLERSASQTLAVGTQIGCRVMAVQGHHELSGAAYPFSMLTGPTIVAKLRHAAEQFRQEEDLPRILGMTIMSDWLQQYLAPPPMPTLVDAYSGEPMLLITDHYRVQDWEALTRALAACSDVRGDRQVGWDRFIECEDRQTRSRATINIGKGEDSIEVFYKTQRYADEGRLWFDELADGAVVFRTREISHPKGLLGRSGESTGKHTQLARHPSDIDPDTLANVIEQAIRRSYANWVDEAIPALDNKTPRQAIQTATGLERVKGLLRSYEASESRQAAEQGRREISYQFLWDALDIAP